MARADIGAGFQYSPDIQQQRSRILGGGHVDHQRLIGRTGVGLCKNLSWTHAVQHRGVAPDIIIFNECAAGQHDPKRGNHFPGPVNHLSFLIAAHVRSQTGQHGLQILSGGSPEQRGFR